MTNYDFSRVEGPLVKAAKTLRRDRRGVVVADSLTRAALDALAEGKVCAIHVRRFFAPSLTTRAARALAREAKPETWIAYGRDTGTGFSVGIPRQYGERSKRAAVAYRREAARANGCVRDAFAPSLSPLDKLRLELDELWEHGAKLGRFEGHPALAGLMRTIESDTLPASTRKIGIVHMDDHDRGPEQPHRLSANLYLSMPKRGGMLSIWDLALDARNYDNPLYRFIARFGFVPGSQPIIHRALPKPHQIAPRVGDLVLIDTARPHAVGGFSEGRRISLQTWVVASPGARPLAIFS